MHRVFSKLGFRNVSVHAVAADIDAQVVMARHARLALELPCYVGDSLADFTRLPGTEVGVPVDLWLLTNESLSRVPRIKTVFEALRDQIVARRGLLEGRMPRA